METPTWAYGECDGMPLQEARSALRAMELRAEAAEKRAEVAEGIIKKHDLCHDLHGQVQAEDFAAGCEAEQRKLYGCAPDADRVIELEKRIAELESRLEIDRVYVPTLDGVLVEQTVPAEQRAKMPDGIECRDVTIHMMNEQVAELEKERNGLMEATMQIMEEKLKAAEKRVTELEAEVKHWKLRADHRWSQVDIDAAKRTGELAFRVEELEAQLAVERERCVVIVEAVAKPIYSTPRARPMFIGNWAEAIVAAIRKGPPA